MTNKYHTVLYTGVTSNLRNRVWEHKTKRHPDSFTSKYNCEKIVYFCFYSRIEEAIAVEKQIKGRSRAYKEKLITDTNPQWKDLWEDLKVTIIFSRRARSIKALCTAHATWLSHKLETK